MFVLNRIPSLLELIQQNIYKIKNSANSISQTQGKYIIDSSLGRQNSSHFCTYFELITSVWNNHFLRCKM